MKTLELSNSSKAAFRPFLSMEKVYSSNPMEMWSKGAYSGQVQMDIFVYPP
jgi:phosphoribosyl-AMP cyclohydrolase